MAFSLKELIRRADPVASLPLWATSALRIEKMRRSYLREVIGIERVSFSANWRKSMFKEILGRNDGLFLVACLRDRVVGYVICLVGDETSHIINLAVHPDFRRRHIGEVLMLSALKESASRRATKAHLELRVSNGSAKRLYEKLGFSVVGVRERYYPDNQEDAIVMWMDNMRASDYQKRLSLLQREHEIR
jgi:ribosomal-protein-alanine N-acetyltransferase